MSKDTNKDKFYSNTYILILSATVIILLAYIIFFTMFGTSVKNQLGWESTSNAIGLVGLITSVITIVFVYKTYQSQSEENRRLKKDAEFNRIIDLIKGHLEYTNRYLEKEKVLDKLQSICDKLYDLGARDYLVLSELLIQLQRITKYLVPVLEIFNTVAENKELSDQELFLLKSIINIHIDRDIIKAFDNIDYILSPSADHLNASKIINSSNVLVKDVESFREDYKKIMDVIISPSLLKSDE